MNLTDVNFIKKIHSFNTKKLIKNNNNNNTPSIDETELQEFLNPGNEGGKRKKYIKLEGGGGKRLVRFGPKWGKYYMKGGKKF